MKKEPAPNYRPRYRYINQVKDVVALQAAWSVLTVAERIERCMELDERYPGNGWQEQANKLLQKAMNQVSSRREAPSMKPEPRGGSMKPRG